MPGKHRNVRRENLRLSHQRMRQRCSFFFLFSKSRRHSERSSTECAQLHGRQPHRLDDPQRPDSLRRSPKATQNETKPGLVSCGARAVGRSPAIPRRLCSFRPNSVVLSRSRIPETKTMHAVGEWVSRPGSNPGAQRVRFPRGVPVFLESKKRWGRMFHRGDAALQAACGGCKPRRLHHFFQ